MQNGSGFVQPKTRQLCTLLLKFVELHNRLVILAQCSPANNLVSLLFPLYVVLKCLLRFAAPETTRWLDLSSQTVSESNATNANFIRTNNKQSLAGVNCNVTQTVAFLIALLFWSGKKSHLLCRIHNAREIVNDGLSKRLVRALPYGTVRVDEPSPFVVSGVANSFLNYLKHSEDFQSLLFIWWIYLCPVDWDGLNCWKHPQLKNDFSLCSTSCLLRRNLR